MNSNPCDKCASFDPVLRGALGGGLRETTWGWCAQKSVYPAKEGPGQKFPEGVARVDDPSTPAKPFLVRRGETVKNCTLYSAKQVAVSKADMIKKLNSQGVVVRK